MKRTAGLIAIAALVCLSPIAWSEDTMSMNASDLKWGDAPPTLPKGAKVSVLHGDPGKSGQFVMRLHAPANYKIPPHWHTTTENLTIVSGALYMGEGDMMDMKKAHAIKAGGYHYLPAKAHHYAFTKAATVVQINAEGPFDINYINPADDPSKAAAPAAKPAEPAKPAPAKK